MMMGPSQTTNDDERVLVMRGAACVAREQHKHCRSCFDFFFIFTSTALSCVCTAEDKSPVRFAFRALFTFWLQLVYTSCNRPCTIGSLFCHVTAITLRSQCTLKCGHVFFCWQQHDNSPAGLSSLRSRVSIEVYIKGHHPVPSTCAWKKEPRKQQTSHQAIWTCVFRGTSCAARPRMCIRCTHVISTRLHISDANMSYAIAYLLRASRNNPTIWFHSLSAACKRRRQCHDNFARRGATHTQARLSLNQKERRARWRCAARARSSCQIEQHAS